MNFVIIRNSILIAICCLFFSCERIITKENLQKGDYVTIFSNKDKQAIMKFFYDELVLIRKALEDINKKLK